MYHQPSGQQYYYYQSPNDQEANQYYQQQQQQMFNDFNELQLRKQIQPVTQVQQSKSIESLLNESNTGKYFFLMKKIKLTLFFFLFIIK